MYMFVCIICALILYFAILQREYMHMFINSAYTICLYFLTYVHIYVVHKSLCVLLILSIYAIILALFLRAHFVTTLVFSN